MRRQLRTFRQRAIDNLFALELSPSQPQKYNLVQISVIIPTLNEAENIGRLVRRLKECGNECIEKIVVVDANSADNTIERAKAAGAEAVISPKRGRAVQMNYGVSLTQKSDILYFVHGDALPPKTCFEEIKAAVKEGYHIGGFRFKFDSDRPILKFNSYMTRFNKMFVRGGDQSIFITRKAFEKLGGYKEDFIIMEEYDLIQRAAKEMPYKVIQNDVIVSARKYDDNSWLRVQIANSIVFTMYRFGASQQRLATTYKWLLNYRYNKKGWDNLCPNLCVFIVIVTFFKEEF